MKVPEADIGCLMADLRAIPWLAPTYPAELERVPGPKAGAGLRELQPVERPRHHRLV